MASLPVTKHEPAPITLPVHTTGWGLFKGGMVVAIVLLLVGALTLFFIGHWGTGNFVDTDAKRVLERQKILADRNTEDAKLLHDPASFVAKDKGIVRVPIDRAIVLTIPELAAVQPHAAYPVKQSPPQPAGAPTSPDKGTGAAEAGNAINPPASNPTVGQPSPAPAAAAPTAAPATSASSPLPSPAASSAPTAASAPVPAATAVPTGTPMGVPAPSPDNNANNPGNPPVPGTTIQPAVPTPALASSVAPGAGSKPEPLTAPPTQSTPNGTATDAATPPPVPTAPGASPAGTP